MKVVIGGTVFLVCGLAMAQAPATHKSADIHLRVEAGTPLRLYLTHRIWYRKNEPVEAKFAEPVWAFDRVVIPAGAVVKGQVTELDAVPRMIRAKAIVGGDFTPLKRARISFTNVTLPDGRPLQLATQESLGLATIYVGPRPKKAPKSASNGQGNAETKTSKARQFIQQQAKAQINSRTQGFYDLIRGPNKREWVESFLLMKLPYHPQWYRSGTRFDAVLEQALDFGEVQIPSETLEEMRSGPMPDSVAEMRILSTISSSDAQVGDRMDGVLSQPLFNADHKLVLPQGTRLKGKITLARRARMLHRGGKLRFAVENVEVPGLAETASSAALPARSEAVQAQLAGVEADPKAVKVDAEGTAKATESKTRLLRPAIAGLVAAKSMDNDEGKQTASGTGEANTSGRSLGGFSGFGLLGIAAAQGPRQIGSALGFYGLAWSVYSNVISRGREVTFEKNTSMTIRFGSPPGKRR